MQPIRKVRTKKETLWRATNRPATRTYLHSPRATDFSLARTSLVLSTAHSSVLPHSHEWDVVRSPLDLLYSSNHHEMADLRKTVSCDGCSG